MSRIVKLLFIGDLIGRPGRSITATLLPKLKKEFSPDLVIANGENVAGGAGMTVASFNKMKHYGIQVITSGNHIFQKKEVLGFIDREPNLLRPANYPPGAPGVGTAIVSLPSGVRIGVINLVGRVFMKPVDCPFRKADSLIDKMSGETDILFVDFHAEATSEKQLMGWYINGRVTAMVGTHTHVQTADEQILSKGTAYITDVGMTGPFDSIIGIRPEQSLSFLRDAVPDRYRVAEGNLKLNAVIVEADADTGRALSIERIVRSLERIPDEIARADKED